MKTSMLTSFVLGVYVAIAAGQVSLTPVAVAPPAHVGHALPAVVITPVAHVGDPAPGIPGAFLDWIATPQIDAAGNVMFFAFLAGPDIDLSNYMAIFYGPPGDLALIAWQGDPAPDMGGAVVMESLLFAGERLSETGWIAFTADLSGPGIVPGVNDSATFVGPPGDIRKVLQGGDQAPGLDEGITIFVGSLGGVYTALSDSATLYVSAVLAGAGVDATNNHAYWTGTRDDLQLVWRKGMPAPGTEPGVTFAWADLVAFNDAGEEEWEPLWAKIGDRKTIPTRTTLTRSLGCRVTPRWASSGM